MSTEGKNILILEDDETRVKKFRRKFIGHAVDVVATVEAAIEHLKNKKVDALFLDHDLGGQVMVSSGPGTGYEVACWLEENPQYIPAEVYIHTLNPSGRRMMQLALPMAEVAPCAWEEKCFA